MVGVGGGEIVVGLVDRFRLVCVGYIVLVGLVGGHVIGLVVEDRREEGKDACV